MSLDDLTGETELKFITRLQDAKTNAEDFDRLQRAAAGLETGDGSHHYALLETMTSTASASKKRGKSGTSDSGFWIDLIQRQIEDMQRLIDSAEADFASQYGEDWREQFAMRILDPDIMPQRRDGESMEDYRERVEQALMDELLNEDGTVKAKYKDHPEYGKLAQWAQWKHDQQQALALRDDLSDPDLSAAERQVVVEQYTQSATYQRLNQEGLVSASNPARHDLMAAKEEMEDEALDIASSASENSFQL